MKNTKKESNKSKNHEKRRKEGKHKKPLDWDETLSRASLFCVLSRRNNVSQTFAFSNTQQQQQQQQHAHKKHTTRARLLFSSLKQKRRAEISAQYSLSALFILEVSAKWWWQQEEIRFREERKRKDDDENGGNDDNVSPVFFFFEQQLQH